MFNAVYSLRNDGVEAFEDSRAKFWDFMKEVVKSKAIDKRRAVATKKRSAEGDAIATSLPDPDVLPAATPTPFDQAAIRERAEMVAQELMRHEQPERRWAAILGFFGQMEAPAICRTLTAYAESLKKANDPELKRLKTPTPNTVRKWLRLDLELLKTKLNIDDPHE